VRRLFSVVLLLTVLAVAAPVAAQQGGIVPPRFDPGQPIHITAERMEADNNREVVRFMGNVVVVQNDAVLNCDMLVLEYEGGAVDNAGESDEPLAALPERSGELTRLIAIGRVQMVQGQRRATCDRAEYDHRRGTILLTGNPEVAQGTDVLRGSRIQIRVKSQQVEVLGGGPSRVQVTIKPRSAQAAAEAERKKQEQQEGQ